MPHLFHCSHQLLRSLFRWMSSQNTSEGFQCSNYTKEFDKHFAMKCIVVWSLRQNFISLKFNAVKEYLFLFDQYLANANNKPFSSIWPDSKFRCQWNYMNQSINSHDCVHISSKRRMTIFWWFDEYCTCFTENLFFPSMNEWINEWMKERKGQILSFGGSACYILDMSCLF